MGNDLISVVLVGCGAVSRFFYAPSLAALEAGSLLKVEALVDPAPHHIEPLSALFPHAAKAASLEELPLAGRLVVIASPPKFHAKATIYALEKGATVLCEKPMASTVAEAETMVAAAQASGSLLAVGLYKRFFPACEALKGLLEKAPLGRLQRFTIEEGGKFGWQAASDSFFRKSVTPGGILLDIGVHVLDLLLWWLDEPETVRYEDDAMGGQEANCRIDLTYRGGARGEVRLSRDWQTRNEYTFYFERGVVRYKVNEANHLEIKADGMPTLLGGSLHAAAPTADPLRFGGVARSNPQSFIQQICNVAAAMRGREPLRIPGEEGVRSLRLIEQCYSGRQLMPQPWLTPREAEAACRVSKGGVQ
ncbi:MAG: Gfo/Idh/MocA family oxidoreductase [Verrucomicrobia bacterium]|nr:Gfo/Idh/MocA family oxidoreductase [Verrucomicrobiota bacterium]